MVAELVVAALVVAVLTTHLIRSYGLRRYHAGYEACHRHLTSKLATAQFFRRPQLTRRRPEAKS